MKARGKITEAETALMAELLDALRTLRAESSYAVRVRPWVIRPTTPRRKVVRPRA